MSWLPSVYSSSDIDENKQRLSSVYSSSDIDENTPRLASVYSSSDINGNTPKLSSVYSSSDIDRNTPSPAESELFSSDIVEDLHCLKLDQPCGPCQEDASSKIFVAVWFCQDCEDFLCSNCKLGHDELKLTTNHKVVALHKFCDQCGRKNKTESGDWFCKNCDDYLCEKCKCSHRKFKPTKRHHIVNCQEMTKEWNTESSGGMVNRDDLRELGQMQNKSSGNECGEGSMQQKKGPFRKDFTHKSSSKRTAKAIYKFNVKVPGDKETPSICSSAFLPGGRLLLVDFANQKLKLFNERFRFVSEKIFSSFPVRLAVFNESEIALTLSERKIIRLSVNENIVIKKSVSVGFNANAVDYICKDRLAVTSLDPDVFYVCTTNGEVLSMVSTDDRGNNLFSVPSYVTVDRARFRVYVSDETKHTVYALNITGRSSVLFSYEHKYLNAPAGIALDKEGNLYVCGEQSNNVHQISPCGELMDIILTENEGVNKPNSISFTSDGDRFVIGNLDDGPGETVTLYSLSQHSVM